MKKMIDDRVFLGVASITVALFLILFLKLC